MKQAIKIGTRESQLAVWQATLVKDLLEQRGVASEIIFIKSEGDLDTVTPLYELGVQGIFTKSLDTALLNNRIDIAVHSLKDVPTKLAGGIRIAAVLERASFKDILVYKGDLSAVSSELALVSGAASQSDQLASRPFTIATSSIRRMAQWLHRYPNHLIDNLRGNVNTRLRKLNENDWNGAIFAAAGLERIHLRPQNSMDLDWMLPAPAQGAITIACREHDNFSFETSRLLNHRNSELCTNIERDFLRGLMGGCSTPISALALIENNTVVFKGNICSPDGKIKIDIEKKASTSDGENFGAAAAAELLENQEAKKIIYGIRNVKK